MLAIINLVPMVWRLVAVAALLASLGGFLAYEHHKLVVEGENAELQKIENDNAAERKKAQEGSNDVDRCFASGRFWDRDNGVCVDSPR